MTNIADLLGNKADSIARKSISIGDVHLLRLGSDNGITPKNGEQTREKFFVVLGFDDIGNVIGGIVVNSKINQNLPTSVTDYLMPIQVEKCPFLKYNSYANCSQLKTVRIEKFNAFTYRGRIDDIELLNQIVGTVIESPYSNKQQLKEFGIIKE